MPRVLLLAATTGYQTRAFGEAAERIGVDLLFATDRCDMLEDPWRDSALPIRFHDISASVARVVEASQTRAIDGVIAVGDRPTEIAAGVLAARGLPGQPAHAAAAARNKRLTRQQFRDHGLPVPRFAVHPLAGDPETFATGVGFPAVIKPLALSGSRGVMRVNNPSELVSGCRRLQRLLSAADVRAERNQAHDRLLIEEFIEGREFAVEGLMNHGVLDVLAIFDKPDPLDGPYFEETIYVTPSNLPADGQRAMVETVARAAAALGLYHGPVHAECRVNDRGVFVLEVAARPIGGLCARALRFTRRDQSGDAGEPQPLFLFEEVLLRHALGEASTGWRRESVASGVMMIPIPARGIFRGVSGVAGAREVPGIEDVRVTAKLDQLLLPLPEGASYLGFIFARAGRPLDVDRALRQAHARLAFAIVPEVPVVQSRDG